LFHYTDGKGYKAIVSQVVWLFKAFKPPGNRPKGAYFTTLLPGTKNLNKFLFGRGCADKTKFVFSFSGGSDLRQLRGGRGEYIYYSDLDYRVEKSRQGPHGATDKVKEQLE